MPSFNINFSKNTQKASREKKAVLAMLVVFIFLILGLYFSQKTLNDAKKNQLSLENSLLHAQSAEPAPLDKRFSAYWRESKVNWAALFSTIEALNNPDITLLTIDPRRGEQKLLLSGLAKDQETLNLYLTKLETSPALHQVELQRYQRTTQSPNGIEFFVVAFWSGDD